MVCKPRETVLYIIIDKIKLKMFRHSGLNLKLSWPSDASDSSSKSRLVGTELGIELELIHRSFAEQHFQWVRSLTPCLP